jgi:hypothetical protein
MSILPEGRYHVEPAAGIDPLLAGTFATCLG